MSERLYTFTSTQGATAVTLPYDLDATLAAWDALRHTMVRRQDPAFTREEWAYLITFVDSHNLRRPFERTFGAATGEATAAAPLALTRLARPRGPIALWLPNNVSLLGPLTLILLLLTGNSIRVKGGSTSEDLTGAFLAYVREHDATGVLRSYLDEMVNYAVFGRDDPRNREMASEATMRVIFGSDAAAQSVHALPHPLGSIGFSNSDRRSEAWIEAEAASDELLGMLIRVFAIYGQAGCTSPGRVVLLNQKVDQAVALRDRLLDLWAVNGPRGVAPHVASNNVMARQWAAGLGWNAALTSHNQAVLAAGDVALPPVPGLMLLPIVAATTEEAVVTLPRNIQTLGYGVAEPRDERWLRLLARTRVKRFVPLRQMHHFGSLWDGEAYWMQAFEQVQFEVET